MLSEENIIFMNELKTNNPAAFSQKLKILGITDADVPCRPVKAMIEKNKNREANWKVFYMGGKPYVDKPSAGYMSSSSSNSTVCDTKIKSKDEKMESSCGDCYLVDGDNHVYQAFNGIGLLSEEDEVIVYVTQDGLRDKLQRMYGNKINVIPVKSGSQAVDNRIKTYLGNAIKDHRKYEKIHIVSHDKGYREIIKRYRKKYNLKADELDLRETI